MTHKTKEELEKHLNTLNEILRCTGLGDDARRDYEKLKRITLQKLKARKERDKVPDGVKAAVEHLGI